MAKTAPLPTYAQVAAGTRASVGVRAEQTDAIAKMRPGARMEIAPEDCDLRTLSSRTQSRMRSARLITGRDYASRVIDGRLFVVCLRPETAEKVK